MQLLTKPERVAPATELVSTLPASASHSPSQKLFGKVRNIRQLSLSSGGSGGGGHTKQGDISSCVFLQLEPLASPEPVPPAGGLLRVAPIQGPVQSGGILALAPQGIITGS